MDRETSHAAPESTDPDQLPWAPTFALLYVAAVALLAWRIGSRPGFSYNWETYTLRDLFTFVAQPSRDVLRMNDGLMTDSGRTASVVGPAWLGFKIFGQSWFGLRFPIVLISALAVPMTWVFGRRLYSDAVGITAALLVLTSQVFLLYGRTGTVVGMSIGPAVIGYLLLWMCVRENDRHWLRWLLLFQVALILNSYVYSPIRFLWPIAAVLFALEFVLRGGQRSRFLVSLIVPLALSVLRPGSVETPVAAVEGYYHGRGEQIFGMTSNPNGVAPFLRNLTPEQQEQISAESTDQQARRLVRQNANDLFDLLIDRNTRPAVTDFWNPHGRLYPRVLVPFFVVGMLSLLILFLFDVRARLMLALFWGYSLPLLVTTQVHIGRLVFIVPVLAIICALPIGLIARLLANRQPTNYRPAFHRWAAVAIGLLIAVIGAAPSMADWETPFPMQRMPLVAERIVSLTNTPPTEQLVYVFGDLGGYEVETLRVAELRMELPGYLRFEDMTTGEISGTGPIPLIYGAVIPLLSQPDAIPGYCANLYLVEPNVLDQFHQASDAAAQQACGQLLRVDVLDV
jgi:dolichyl-phosphate-mannose-protein mannosyltransferase